MADSLVSFMAMEEGLNERNVVAKVLSDPDGRARTGRLLKEAKLAVREQLDLHRPARAPAGPRRAQPAGQPAGAGR